MSIWNGYVRRHNEMMADPNWYTIGNAVTSGLFELVKNVFFPEEAWSLQHLLDILSLVFVVVSFTKLIRKVSGKVKGAKPKSGVAGTSESIKYTYDPLKIGKQMSKRGWTEELIQQTLDEPIRTVKTRDTRWLPGANGPLNDPATAYYAVDGSYVVRNDITGVITQISNKFDPDWVAPWDFPKK